MNIQEATKQALEENKYMTREKSALLHNIKIKPTSTSTRCIAYKKDGSGDCRAWLPYANDLTANDWVVVD